MYGFLSREKKSAKGFLFLRCQVVQLFTKKKLYKSKFTKENQLDDMNSK